MIASLNDFTLERIITQCEMYPNYEGVIVLPRRVDIYEFAQEIMRGHSLRPIPFLRDIRTNYNCSVLRFTNGSSIELTTTNTMRIGDRYHTVLVHKGVNNEFIDKVHHFEKPYEHNNDRFFWRKEYNGKWIEAQVVYDELDSIEDTKALDEFLKHFKINNQ